MRRTSTVSFVVSLLVHVVVVAVLVLTWRVYLPVPKLFGDAEPVPERVEYVELPRGEVNRSGVAGGDGRPETPEVEAPRLVAPTVVPSTLPDPGTVATPAAPTPSSGPLVGGGGPTRGVQPSYVDGRVWAGAAPLETAPRTWAERLDSSLVARIGAANDSAALYAESGRDPGDWTFERGGQKWGVDQRYIRLGPVKIPTAVLGALPLNAQQNPIVAERERAFALMREDIQYHAQRSMNEDEFRKAVQRIRERKDRERREQREREGSGGETIAGEGARPK
ncbi:MAG TPA: hypothetical protein VFZ11_04375 [Gemmatimonadaceae bacterium]